AALRHVDLLPRDLQRVLAIRRQPFERRHLLAGDGRDGRLAGTDRAAIEVHRAGAAQAGAAAELGAFQVEDITDDPQQRHVRRDIDSRGLSVNSEGNGHLGSWVGRGRTVSVTDGCGCRYWRDVGWFGGSATQWLLMRGGTRPTYGSA